MAEKKIKKVKPKVAKLFNSNGDLIARIKMGQRPREIYFQGGRFQQDTKHKKRFHRAELPQESAGPRVAVG